MGPVVLVVLDGWGISAEKRGNAIAQAKTPHYLKLLETFPNGRLEASGTAVGLPPGLMGNSEVGHLTLGSGRVVIQKLTLISQTIAEGSFYKNPVLLQATKASETGALHVFGLLSDGCVHSSLDHLDGIFELTRRERVKEVIIHPILDGRDTPPKSALRFIKSLKAKLKDNEKIGVVCGRYYAMDRDNRWERIEQFWNALVLGNAKEYTSADLGIEEAYAAGITDEFVKPFIVNNRPLSNGDSVLCFNFRPDRVRQITRALTQSEFDGFVRPKIPKIFYACFTEYDAHLKLPVAFDASSMDTPEVLETLPEILGCHHIGQFHTAETEKYAHVTYFFNGGKEEPQPQEKRELIASLKVATYDLAPAMQTAKVCQAACQAITSQQYPFIILNFANPDMVGHTGILEAAVEAVESVDQAFAQLLETVQSVSGTLLITADHGNCEQMIDLTTGEPHTAHTTNPVPFIVANLQKDPRFAVYKGATMVNGTLADVAPTILELMNIAQPKVMTGKSLIGISKVTAI